MIRFVLVCLIFFSSAAYSGDRGKLINEFINASGVEKLIDSMPAQFEQQHIQRAPTAKDPEMEAQVLQILLQTFDVGRAKQIIYSYVDESMEHRDLLAISEWLRSLLGKRLTEAEDRQTDPNFQADFLNYVAYLQSSPPTQDRIEQIQELEASARMTDLTVGFLRLLMEGMLVSYSKASEDEAYSLNDLDETLDTVLTTLRELLWEQNLLVAHFLYQDFTNEEIEAYSNFLGSSSGQAYLNVSVGAFTAVFNDLFEQVIPRFEALAKDKQSEAG